MGQAEIFRVKLIYPEPDKDFHELTEHSQCWYMLEHIKSNHYDAIRNDELFVKVAKELSENAW